MCKIDHNVSIDSYNAFFPKQTHNVYINDFIFYIKIKLTKK